MRTNVFQKGFATFRNSYMVLLGSNERKISIELFEILGNHQGRNLGNTFFLRRGFMVITVSRKIWKFFRITDRVRFTYRVLRNK